ncbi:MAG: hypothetical protein DDT34_01941 [Firmicutes bacterium]|nr:hypothetical protein [Bacillota bacterium]
MISECAKCPIYVCRVGDREHGPEACPMQYDFPAAEGLYVDPDIRRVARVAALVEAAGYRRWRRAEEVIEFARRLGFYRLGVVSCSDMAGVAELYIDVLKKNGFETIRAGNSQGECEPVAHAALCNDRGTDLNILLGMCVGHDSMFIRHSKAWVTCLVAKDRFLVHNPVGALYGANGYFSQALREHQTEQAGHADADMAAGQLAAAAKEVCSQGHGRWTRVEETMEFARKLGVIKLGLIFCAGFRYEAAILTDILEANGFEVVSVGCKAGAVPKEWIGISDSEKVRPGRPEMICNPLAQAELLNRSHTGLNILMGQCVGHDSLSMKHSEAPVVCLIAKDRVLAHNTVAALYESRGYLRSALYQEHRTKERKGSHGGS